MFNFKRRNIKVRVSYILKVDTPQQDMLHCHGALTGNTLWRWYKTSEIPLKI